MSYDGLGTGNVNMRTATSHPVSFCGICCNHNYDDSYHENHGDNNDDKDHHTATSIATSIRQVIISIIHT